MCSDDSVVLSVTNAYQNGGSDQTSSVPQTVTEEDLARSIMQTEVSQVQSSIVDVGNNFIPPKRRPKGDEDLLDILR